MEKRLDQSEEPNSEVIQPAQTTTSDIAGEKTPEKFDEHGFALVPQPSIFKDDPLVSLHFERLSTFN
jgi:hypothetical protein